MIDKPRSAFVGTENESFTTASVEKMYQALKCVNPNQDYVFEKVPGYGHVDHFIGKKACFDVWPNILKFLDKYAENNVAKSRKVVRNLKHVVDSVKFVSPQQSRPGLFLLFSNSNIIIIINIICIYI